MMLLHFTMTSGSFMHKMRLSVAWSLCNSELAVLNSVFNRKMSYTLSSLLKPIEPSYVIIVSLHIRPCLKK